MTETQPPNQPPVQPAQSTQPTQALPVKVKIVEVGPRDGLQNESNVLCVDTRIALIDQLEKAGLRHIEVGSFVHPKWVPQMAGSDRVMSTIMEKMRESDGVSNELNSAGFEGMSYPALVPNLKGLEMAMASGVREIAVFASASESFTQKNINCSIAQSIERFSAVIETALDHDIKVRGYVSCVMDCPYEGKVDPDEVVNIASKLSQMGCYEISLGDTIGTGTPNRVTDLIKRLSAHLPVEQMAVHFHDTYGQALVNIYAALLCGVSVIDSSVAGLGGCPYAKGASGNVATEDVVYLLNGLGIEHGVDLDKLIRAGRFICSQLEKNVVSKVNQASHH